MRLRSVLLGAAAAAAGVVAALRRGAAVAGRAPDVERRPIAPVDPGDRVDADRAGLRGDVPTVRLDLDGARAGRVEPVVEFLTFVQEQRGDRSHLLFVRYDDLDALAASEGQGVDAFLSRLDQLGVVVSVN